MAEDDRRVQFKAAPFGASLTEHPAEPLMARFEAGVRRWSKHSRLVSFIVNFHGFSRDGVATLYVFFMLALCTWLLFSSQSPTAIRIWAAYKLGAGFKQFTRFLTRREEDKQEDKMQ